MTPDLRRLEQFVAVMEEPTLLAAARRLHLTQQALSSALRQLERELSTTLFSRSGRKLAPTPAAEALYEGAPSLLAGARLLASRVHDVGVERQRPFVVGRSPAVTADEAYSLLSPLFEASSRQGECRTPELPSITVKELFPAAMTHELHHGTVDIVLRRGVALPTQLAGSILTYQPLRVALHRNHPLAESRSLTLADLALSPIIVWAPPHASFYTDFLVAQCRRAGFEPDLLVNRIQGTPPVTAVITAPDAAAFVTGPTGPRLDDQAVVLPLTDAPKVPVQALWLPHTTSLLRTRLLEVYATT